MKPSDVYIETIRNGIEELRTEKYQQDKNGTAKAIQITLNHLQKMVDNLTSQCYITDPDFG